MINKFLHTLDRSILNLPPVLMKFCTEQSDSQSIALIAEDVGHFIHTHEIVYYNGMLSVQWNDQFYRMAIVIDGKQISPYLYASRDLTKVYISKEWNVCQRYFMDLLYHVYRQHCICISSSINAHAAVVVSHGEGIMFVGESGAGKSTQAELWKKYTDAWVLNYDKPTIGYYNHRLVVSGTPWGGKEGHCDNRTVPLRCIVHVNKAKHNNVTMIPSGKAYSLIFGLFAPCFFVEGSVEKYSVLLHGFLNEINVYELECTPDKEAVQTLYDILYDDYESERKVLRMRIKDGFIIRNIMDDWVVIPRGKNALHFNATLVTNEVGAVLWNVLRNDSTQLQLVEAILSEYDVERSVAERDVALFIQQLSECGVLEEVEV